MAAHAKRAGRENRAAYRRWMGTPTRRPMYENEPFGETPDEYQAKHFPKPKPKNPMDTSDMRNWTP
jgi:hypothetical protein